MDEIIAYACGTPVTLIHEGYSAIITALTIRESIVVYEVSYFHAGEIKTAWISELLFDTGDAKKKRIGFLCQPSKP